MQASENDKRRPSKYDEDLMNVLWETVRENESVNQFERGRGRGRKGKNSRLTTAKTTSELDVLGLNGDTLGVDSSQVGVFK